MLLVTPLTGAHATTGGKLLSISGTVSVHRAGGTTDAGAPFLDLAVGDRVETGERSRAAILLADETQIKLNSLSSLTVTAVAANGGLATAAAASGASGTELSLGQGEAWVRRKSPGGFELKTPTASAAIRGTEFDVAQSGDGETRVAVLEGVVSLANDVGDVSLASGALGTARPGQAPVRTMLVEPENAVQWTLYYPTRLPAADFGAAAGAATFTAVQASLEAEASGDGERARALLTAALAEHRDDPALVTRLAALDLASGRAAEARDALDRVLAAHPENLAARELRSVHALVRNQLDAASADAEAALAAHPESAPARVAVARVFQARFDLEGAERLLREAIAADPANVAAHLDLARILFGSDRVAEARETLARARSLAAGDSEVLTLDGFAALARGDTERAAETLNAAARANPERGEPHLGLGLALFRRGHEGEGLTEMLVATLLEPRVALYQSYLGKSYLEARRFPEALDALDRASQLDPRDPTPWVYRGAILRDLNRPVEAVEAYLHAVELNDNRAVYRSRYLLDRDLAAKNVSQGQVYDELGFSAWATSQAVLSLERDPLESAAHLFLANAFGSEPDRNVATASELLQTRITLPVNANTFNTFNEYTSLLEVPHVNGEVGATVGDFGFAEAGGNVYGGNDSIAAIQLGSYRNDPGWGMIDTEQQSGFSSTSVKVALGPRASLLGAFDVQILDGGDPSASDISVLDPVDDTTFAVKRIFPAGLDRDARDRALVAVPTFGAYAELAPGTDLLGAVEGFTIDDESLDTTDLGDGLVLTQQSGFEHYAVGSSAVLRHRLDPVVLMAAIDAAWLSDGGRGRVTLLDTTTGETLEDPTPDAETEQRSVEGVVRAEAEGPAGLFGEAGVQLAWFEGGDFRRTEKFDPGPFVGVRWEALTGLRLRAAYMEVRNVPTQGSRLTPSVVSGFPLFVNQFDGQDRQEVDGGIEWELGPRTFLGLTGFHRSTDFFASRYDADTESFELLPVDEEQNGGRLAVNQILSGWFSAFAEARTAASTTKLFDERDDEVRLGLNFIHPSSLRIRATIGYLNQTFGHTEFALDDEDVWLLGLTARYELFEKRLRIEGSLSNLLDERYTLVADNLATPSDLAPKRDLRVKLTYNW
ncbi:MAG: tetratricopeptide repeat protein [Deltaproteobacteria bacterium]|nr:tetratricopeptide repeat protein [Deltaproteobacteria bacterium]